MEEIKVSIIMPCLNAGEYIGEAIESILHQTLKEIELNIVDAGSIDNTLEIIKIYQKNDDRIVFLHSDQKSLGYQYNLGIQNARGKYIGFVESDDYIHAQMYEKMYDMAEQEHLDFAKSDFSMFIGERKKQLLLKYSILLSKGDGVYGKAICPADYPEFMKRDVNIWNGIYNREFLLKNQIFFNTTQGAAFQDLGFVIKSFVSAKKIMYMKIPSYYYRKDNMAASVYNHSDHIRFVMNEFRCAWEYMKERSIKSPFRAVVFKRCFGMFCAYFDYSRFHGGFDKTLQEDVPLFMHYLAECYKELDYFEIRENQLDASLSLSVLENMDCFETVRYSIDSSERNMKINFFNKVRKRSLIIFGAGENGTAMYAFLRKNRVETVLCFCDNDRSKAGTKIMGEICILPDMLQEQFRERLHEILFIVAVESYFSDICRQLEKLGVNRKNIILYTSILPHNAFEINMEDYSNE